MINNSNASSVSRTAAWNVHACATPKNWVISLHIHARRHVPQNTCMALLLYITLHLQLSEGWAELLVELQRLSRAGIGWELCQSGSRRSPTSSVLLFCSSQRGEGNGCFLQESALLPEAAPCHLSLTYSAYRKLSDSSLVTLPAPLRLCLCQPSRWISQSAWSCFSLPVVLQQGGRERRRPVPGRRKPWWEALLVLPGAGDAERGEGGPVWAGTAAPAAGGVPGRPPLLPQLPAGTNSCAELYFSAQLPPPGEPHARWHT